MKISSVTASFAWICTAYCLKAGCKPAKLAVQQSACRVAPAVLMQMTGNTWSAHTAVDQRPLSALWALWDCQDDNACAQSAFTSSTESGLTNRTAWSIIQEGLLMFNTGQDSAPSRGNGHRLLPEGASSAVDTTLLHWLHKMHLSRKRGDAVRWFPNTDSNVESCLIGGRMHRKSSNNL